MILNGWDCQSKRIHDTSGVIVALCAGDGGGVREPWVLVKCGENDDIPENNGSFDGEQPSGQLLRSGCVQRHVDRRERERESMDCRERTTAPDTSAESGGCAEHDARPTDRAVYAARRLTPTECARLQGFPDDWASDVQHTDSAEYKMWGNGIALPCLLPMMKAMADILGDLDER